MHKVILVEPLSDYRLKLQFEDGLQQVFDVKPFISKGISAELQDSSFFEQVSLESGGGISWPNGYDFCPNFLYETLQSDELEMVVLG